MRPSERIRGAAELLLKDRYNIDQVAKPVERNALIATVFAAEILAYLDEQYEREACRRQVLELALAYLSGRGDRTHPGDVRLGPNPGPSPEPPARVAELVREVAKERERNWLIPERADYCEALLRWLEESQGPA